VRRSVIPGSSETEIDWILITYYRYEGVIQDLIEDAGQVVFREDLNEEARPKPHGNFAES
jgi:hypothetical protein